MMPLSLGVWLGGCSALAGGILVYLGSPNQGLLDASLGRKALLGGVFLLATALLSFLSVMRPAAAVAVWCVSTMLVLMAAPFLALLRGRRS